jgi:two-component system, response regulator
MNMLEFRSVDILLVEDNATDAELCIDALRGRNLANDLVWVKDGAEALEVLLPSDDRSTCSPKVVLLDLQLPKVTGLEVLRKIRSDERTRRLPVVVLTSSKEDRDVIEAYDLGVNSFISKPVQFEAFAEVAAQLGCYWVLTNRRPP